jgi:hypothetical protein
MLLIVVGPSFGKTHNDMYSVPCSVLWSAVKDALRNSGKYGILGIDNTEMTASFVIGGSLGGKRINSVVLNGKGDTCEMQTQTAFSGLAHNDAGDFKKRVDESLAKQASQPAKPESTTPAEKTNRTAQPVPATEPPKAVPASASEETGGTAPSATATAPPKTAPASAAEGTTTVSVATIPDGAEIYVDGTFFGNAPANLKLPAGKHTIRITHSDYKDWSREIGVQAGSEARIVATLEKK